jgi:class 3 adenylate cyclase
VEAQIALTEANAGVPPDKRINFRIGVHIGDVMVRARDLFGDGVSISARLQTLANPGSVCISAATCRTIPIERPRSPTQARRPCRSIGVAKHICGSSLHGTF